MKLISIKKLDLGYEGKKVINNLSISINAGEYICIVGENGSGKSTLLKGILGLLKSSNGTIDYINLNKKEIGYLPQISTNQRDFPASVYEVVLSGTLNEGRLISIPTKKQKEMVLNSLKKLDIEDLKNRSFKELSGGQIQRVLLARALCGKKKLIVLDEPTSGLDPKMSEEMYSIISKINKEGITIVMVSHDIDSIFNYASKVLDLTPNQIFYGSTEEYINNHRHDCFEGEVTC